MLLFIAERIRTIVAAFAVSAVVLVDVGVVVFAHDSSITPTTLTRGVLAFDSRFDFGVGSKQITKSCFESTSARFQPNGLASHSKVVRSDDGV